MIKKLLVLTVVSLSVLIPCTSQNINAASEWDNAVTVYGAALESDTGLQEQTADLLGASDSDIIDYVYSEDVSQYVNQNYDNSVLMSSIRIQQTSEGSGLNINIDESLGNITMISEETYQNALLTSGITDADVTIAAAQDVTGESALAGVYKAYAAQGEEIDPEKTQNAQDELDAISDITNENSNVEGFTQVQLNKVITEVKVEIINNFNGDVSEEQIRSILDEKLAENGLEGLLSQEQIDRLVEIFNSIKDSGIFTGEEAQRLVDSSEDLLNRITSSDSFQDAKDSASELGRDIADSEEVNSFMEALRNFWDRIVEFFRGLF
ncbi:DUF1002 domain-containing protein [Jeotgalicoccus sp. ATCC 8456]|uniref:DUF1002 domain-containing protein n=1 Tax=Jeotgalicoccus sp. ATCC 8456 TaxID=946435 RepID=UPI0018E62ECE|nr:DUF1002 domain-containing protein [Jeotgalicoccus sp. ATCC 8456]QQD85330.1 DUF1002 domain-containing protein [Jeotgalicoccus sp. ATCC 8456]